MLGGEILQNHAPIASAFLKVNPDGSSEYEQFYGTECIVEFLVRLEHNAVALRGGITIMHITP